MTEANSLNSTAMSRRSLIARSAALAAVPVAAPVAIAALSPIDRDAETDALIAKVRDPIAKEYEATSVELKLEGKAGCVTRYHKACRAARRAKRAFDNLADEIHDRPVKTWRDVVLLATVATGHVGFGHNDVELDRATLELEGSMCPADRSLGFLVLGALEMGKIPLPPTRP